MKKKSLQLSKLTISKKKINSLSHLSGGEVITFGPVCIFNSEPSPSQVEVVDAESNVIEVIFDVRAGLCNFLSANPNECAATLNNCDIKTGVACLTQPGIDC